MPVTGFVAQLHLRPSFPQPQTLLCHGCRLGCAQVCELVEDKYSDVELDDLSLKRPGHHFLNQSFEAIHLRFRQW